MSQKLHIQLTESESMLLESTVGQLGITPQQLARTSVVDALHRNQNDEQFAQAVKSVLEKNAELYERLAK